MKELWCGDQDSRDMFAEAQAKADAFLLKNQDIAQAALSITAGSAFEPIRSEYFNIPPIATRHGSTAVIEVNGSLISGSAGFRRLFDMIGYDEIKAAMMETAADTNLKSIVFAWNTPGGSTNGVQSTGRLIREISKLKPSVSYAVSCNSAGYWLASNTNEIFAEDLALVGSIGCMMQLTSRAKQLEMAGIKVTTLRSGAQKGTGGPTEEHSQETLQVFDELVQDMAAMFFNTVAQNRGIDMDTLRARVGDGRTFLAARAQAHGLIDQIGTLAGAVGRAQALAQVAATF